MTIETLSPADRPHVVEVLVEAFYDYPVFTYVLKDAGDDYDSRLRSLVGFFADARFMRGWPVLGIRADDELAAALLLSDPVFAPRPDELGELYRAVADEIGPDAVARLDEFEAASANYEPKASTYFIGMIGARPRHQGKGLGKALMEHVAIMSANRPESAGVTLTTEDPDNVQFYESLGYRILGSANVGEITTWFFLRKD